MKYLLKHRFATILAILLISTTAFGADIPSRPYPPQLVNDLAGILTSSQVQQLENKLIAYNDSTSTQIVVLTISSFNGYSANEFAYKVGETWGVGQANFDNGIVLLIKPKIGNEYGEVAIGVGYGLEERLTDALSRRIIEKVILPEFREGNTYAGIDKAIDTIIEILLGSYQNNKSDNEDEVGAIITFCIFFAIAMFVIAWASKGKGNGGGSNHGGSRSSDSDLLDALILGSMLGRGSGNSNFGGGSFGGFGGFGGGHFGGGGASGRW